MQVENIVYPKNDKSRFAAVGVTEVKIKSKDAKLKEICIFSQERLSDCEKIAALVYSDPTTKGPLEWKYLCNQQSIMTNRIHLFDFNYAKDWVNFTTADYLHCPICKEGNNDEKKQIEEHEIESMDQLYERRQQSKKDDDIMMVFHVEQLMLDKICQEKWNQKQNYNRIQKNQMYLNDIISHWNNKKKIDEFRPRIINACKIAIKNDSVKIVTQLIQSIKFDKLLYSSETKIFMDLLNYCIECGSYDCSKFLLSNVNVKFELRPIALLNAINTMNKDLIDLVITNMIKRNSSYVCDEIFKETIRKDFVEVAKKIIENRWHKPTDSDYEFAEKLDGVVWSWLKQRRNATKMMANAIDNDTLEWDDDWNDDDNDDDDEDNNDDNDIEYLDDDFCDEDNNNDNDNNNNNGKSDNNNNNNNDNNNNNHNNNNNNNNNENDNDNDNDNENDNDNDFDNDNEITDYN